MLVPRKTLAAAHPRTPARVSSTSNTTAGPRLATSATHQDYFTVTASGGASTGQPYGVVHLPAGLDPEDGTWMPLACTAQLGVRRAEMALGESVGVVGVGMLGQLVVQYLVLMGARRIVAGVVAVQIPPRDRPGL